MEIPPDQSPQKRKKPVREIMIPRRRDFMGDLADWVAESPENAKEFEAMMGEIFEEVGQNRKPQPLAEFKLPLKKPSPKKSFTTKKTPAKPRRQKK